MLNNIKKLQWFHSNPSNITATKTAAERERVFSVEILRDMVSYIGS